VVGNKSLIGQVNISDTASLYLNVIRAICAQLVIIGHAGVFSKVSVLPSFKRLPPIESIAVVIFFILSGFLISLSVSNNLKKDPAYSFAKFLASRFVRIFIVYIPALVFIAAVDTYIFANYSFNYISTLSVQHGLNNLLMLQKNPLTMNPMFGSGSTLWTLSIEWWMYLFFGWIILFKGGQSKFWLVAFVLAIFPVGYSIKGFGAGLPLIWFFSALTIYGINASKEWKHFLGFSILCFVMAIVRYIYSYNAYDMMAAMLLIISFFCFFQHANTYLQGYKSGLTRMFKFFAAYSFTLYLTHFTIMEAINSILVKEKCFGK